MSSDDRTERTCADGRASVTDGLAETANSICVDSDIGPPVDPFSRPIRVLVALTFAMCFSAWTVAYRTGADAEKSDFAQVWFSARALLHGHDPYSLVGPGRAFEWPANLYYPLPAALIATPVAALTRVTAEASFVGVSAAALAWVFTRFGITGLLMLASPAAVMALQVGQWSPLLTAAVFVPSLRGLYAAKPTVGFALWCVRPTRGAIIGGGLLVVATLLLQPAWPLEWIRALRTTNVLGNGRVPYTPPALHGVGPAIVLSLLRWRRPEARLLFTLSLIPQSPILYETLPLLLVGKHWGEVTWMVAAGWISLLAVFLMGNAFPTVANSQVSGQAILLLLYLPAVLMVLRRPNVGVVPTWMERLLERARAPKWIVGTST